ncbi:DinB family protein [Deinococcus cavernae]|uniref:DinB family protein n=1 Tax=Deinococcus cavernae TaxID=2320857 RepID=A0A418V899_9DEIO|nr:DinB family protein [Deinococcus cavernae]RJF72335.1 DinB family protein [Deinococcus cavernae]
MEFNLDDALLLLRRTPATLTGLLTGLSSEWLHTNEGADTWSPHQVVAHLTLAEHHNWLPRVRAILEQVGAFPPFDRFAHLQRSPDVSTVQLLSEFQAVRGANLQALQALNLTPADLNRTGQHPEFGTVTLAQLLSTWTVHDHAHLVQISRTLAGNYREAVGPWQAYLSILR